jgi:hypothetical protein
MEEYPLFVRGLGAGSRKGGATSFWPLSRPVCVSAERQEGSETVTVRRARGSRREQGWRWVGLLLGLGGGALLIS